MRVRILSFGTNWWETHSKDLQDPFCFRRCTAWFNSAGLRYGRRLRLCWIYPGQIRFNQRCGFDPEHRLRFVGRTFVCKGPNYLQGRTHLLFSELLDESDKSVSDHYLVTINEAANGGITFSSREWSSAGVQPISVSFHGFRYEAMLLMGREDWIETALGKWRLSDNGRRLVLDTGRRGDAV